jgi:hypothetical protein
LFDLDLIGISPSSLKIEVSDEVKCYGYELLDKNKLLGISTTKKPNKKALEYRYEKFLRNRS